MVESLLTERNIWKHQRKFIYSAPAKDLFNSASSTLWSVRFHGNMNHLGNPPGGSTDHYSNLPTAKSRVDLENEWRGPGPGPEPSSNSGCASSVLW